MNEVHVVSLTDIRGEGTARKLFDVIAAEQDKQFEGANAWLALNNVQVNPERLKLESRKMLATLCNAMVIANNADELIDDLCAANPAVAHAIKAAFKEQPPQTESRDHG